MFRDDENEDDFNTQQRLGTRVCCQRCAHNVICILQDVLAIVSAAERFGRTQGTSSLRL
jgi:hypothetical protein